VDLNAQKSRAAMARAPLFLDEAGQPLGAPGQPLRASACATWQGVPIEVFSVSGPGQHRQMHTSASTLTLCVNGAGYNDVRSSNSTRRLPWRPGLFVLLEEGFEGSAEWNGSAEEMMSVQFPVDVVSDLMNEERNYFSLPTHMPLEDGQLLSLIFLIREELQRNCSSGKMFAQGLSLALMSYLQNRYAKSTTSHRARGKLSNLDFGKISAFVGDNLSKDIGVFELALELNLSASQFSRAFKATIGISPYQYLQKRRIEKAQDLMRGRESLASIAQIVGLANQSHFGKVFRQITGKTPARERNSRASGNEE
jgi:AraC family transcriptional regulator